MVTTTNVAGASLGKPFLGNFSPNNENIFLPHFLCLLSHVRMSLLLPLWLLVAHHAAGGMTHISVSSSLQLFTITIAIAS